MSSRTLWLVTAAVAPAGVLPASTDATPVAAAEPPLVIGHRGASGHLPEHTLASYRLAIRMGADYIEPDLVSTKDGHLIARHEPNITSTTDVRDHPEFAARERAAVVDGASEEGWFASDFTLAEIKTLRAVQPAAERPQRFNGRYRIPTFDEVIALAKRFGFRYRRQIGVIPETKHPTYHEQLGLPLERKLVATLRRKDWNRRSAPVWIQSFEQSDLKLLDGITSERLVQLVNANDVNPDGSLDYTAPFDRSYDWTVSGDPELQGRTFAFYATNAGLDEVMTYAEAIGPWKPYIVPTAAQDTNGDGTVGDENGDGLTNETDRTTLAPTDLVDRAHARELQVFPYTFRNEQRRLATDYAGNPIKRVPEVLRAGSRRPVLRLPGDRVRRPRALPAPSGRPRRVDAGSKATDRGFRRGPRAPRCRWPRRETAEVDPGWFSRIRQPASGRSAMRPAHTWKGRA